MTRWRFEWPPGSGRAASYTDAERQLMKDLIAQCERGEIAMEELQRQVNIIHDLKVQVDATLVEEKQEQKEEEETFEPSTLFPIPEKAQRVLDERR
jgi:hypothetical protein